RHCAVSDKDRCRRPLRSYVALYLHRPCGRFAHHHGHGCQWLPPQERLNYGSCSTSGPWANWGTPRCLIGPPVLTLGTFPVGGISLAGQIFTLMNCATSADQDAIGCLAG